MLDKPIKICFNHFPSSFGGVSIARPDSYLMVLNGDLPRDQIYCVFDHEMTHITRMHLSSKNKQSRREKEMEANTLQWSFDDISNISIIISPK